ncbi:MAG: hypothetical protein WC159_11370, partial [Sphaerochaetaceae bacterium]
NQVQFKLDYLSHSKHGETQQDGMPCFWAKEKEELKPMNSSLFMGTLCVLYNTVESYVRTV